MRNRRRWFLVVLLGALGSLPGTFAAAQQGDGKSVFAAARTAVAKGQVERSQQIGFSITKTAFTDTPFNGGVLVGFEIGLCKAGNDEVVHCLRALYSTPDGVTSSPDFGQFFDKTNPNGKVQKTKVTRPVRVEADPGYAVAGITFRSRICISGMQLTFQRLNGQRLDPKKSYTSDWVGDPKGGGQSIMSKGSPAIGVFGNVDEPQILALGLIWLKQDQAKAPAAAVKQPVEQPKPRPETQKQPAAKQQAEQFKTPAAPLKQPAEAVKPQLDQPAAPADVKPMIEQRPELNPPPAEPDPQPAEPEPQAEDNAQAAAPEAASDETQGTSDNTGRMVSVMILLVMLIVALVGCGFLAAYQRQPTTSFAHRQLPPSVSPVVKPASGPPPLASADQNIAIAAQPLHQPPPLPLPFAERWKTPVAAEQPPFFTVRLVNGISKRLCRAFLLPKEMLLLDAGMENPNQTAVAFVALGGLVGGLIGHFIAKSQRKTAEDRQRLLDEADTRDLVRLASKERDALWVAVGDVVSAAIEPISFWRSLSTSNCAAYLHLEHRECGPITLELPTPLEARMATDYLAPLLGERLVNRVVWDMKKQRLVAKAGSTEVASSR